MLDRVAPRGRRSSFISQAVLHYVESQGRQSLKARLKAGYQANAAESLGMALEWFPIEGRHGKDLTAPAQARR